MVAVIDLIDGYPEEKIIFIGFFMTDASVQNKGLGSAIISEVIDYLKNMKYLAIRLAWVKENPSRALLAEKWIFRNKRNCESTAADHVILAEKEL